MKYKSWIIIAALGMLGAQIASAKPTPEQVASLGTTQTPIGATLEGNADGTIPPWEGGICKNPPPGQANYKPKYESGGGPYPAPFPDEKPLFRITGENWQQHLDKIDVGTRRFFELWPDTFYMEVYPTHRTACFPDWVYQRTKDLIMNPELVGCPICSLSNAQAQIAFPFPENGTQDLWNMRTVYRKPKTGSTYAMWYVDSAGRGAQISEKSTYGRNYFWNPDLEQDDSRPYSQTLAKAIYPRASVGTLDLDFNFMREDLYGHPVYSYIPGQRRVRLAPEFAYDGVPPSVGGTSLYDEGGGWLGKMDKFDFNLLGLQEIYIPYNVDTDALLSSSDVNLAHFIDPALVRWELHRVWVIKAVLMDGERHVQKEKWFYGDEDSWVMNLMVGIDHGGQVHHYQLRYVTTMYDDGNSNNCLNITYDFSKRAWANWLFGDPGGNAWSISKPTCNTGDVTNTPDRWFSPSGMTGVGVR